MLLSAEAGAAPSLSGALIFFFLKQVVIHWMCLQLSPALTECSGKVAVPGGGVNSMSCAASLLEAYSEYLTDVGKKANGSSHFRAKGSECSLLSSSEFFLTDW